MWDSRFTLSAPGVEYTFGAGTGAKIASTKPAGIERETKRQLRGDGRGYHLQKDLLKPGVWEWDLILFEHEGITPRGQLDRLQGAWTAARKSGETALLRWDSDEDEKLIIGRPGRLQANDLNVAERWGFIRVAVQFEAMTNTVMGGYEKQVTTVSTRPLPSEGFVFPLEFPLFFQHSTHRSQNVVLADNRGTVDAPAKVRFYGPCVHPTVTLGRPNVRLLGQLRKGETVTVDPFNKTILDNSGRSRHDMLDPWTPLSELVVPPGLTEVTVKADYGSYEKVVGSVYWRDTWPA